VGNKETAIGLGLSATGFGLPAGVPLLGVGIKKSLEPPELPELSTGTVDEEAVRARKREIDRARAAGRQTNILTRLGGAPATSGLSVARSELSASPAPGGSTLG
jgi:hypothetical protein